MTLSAGSRKIVAAIAALALVLLLRGECLSGVRFDELYGSDLGTGIGAKAAGMSGAVVAIADDASATFWNPAGLAAANRNQVFLSAEGPSDFSAAALSFQPEIKPLEKIDFTMGFAYLTRLRFEGDSGRGDWSGYPSQLLDLAMIDVDDDFQGAIDSKTSDFRISLAARVPYLSNLHLGVNYIFLE